jgi:hypothetical protein
LHASRRRDCRPATISTAFDRRFATSATDK